MWSLKSPWKVVAFVCMNPGPPQLHNWLCFSPTLPSLTFYGLLLRASPGSVIHVFLFYPFKGAISTCKFSILISIHFLEKLVERICLKIKAFSLSWSFYWFSWAFLLIMYWYLLGENLYWLLLGPEGLRLTICCSCRSPERVRNPHLRAKLAETLEALIPVNRSQNSSGLLSPSSVNMVCIRNLENCANYHPPTTPSSKFCRHSTPNPSACQPLSVLQEDSLWFPTTSGFYLR